MDLCHTSAADGLKSASAAARSANRRHAPRQDPEIRCVEIHFLSTTEMLIFIVATAPRYLEPTGCLCQAWKCYSPPVSRVTCQSWSHMQWLQWLQILQGSGLQLSFWVVLENVPAHPHALFILKWDSSFCYNSSRRLDSSMSYSSSSWFKDCPSMDRFGTPQAGLLSGDNSKQRNLST